MKVKVKFEIDLTMMVEDLIDQNDFDTEDDVEKLLSSKKFRKALVAHYVNDENVWPFMEEYVLDRLPQFERSF